MAQPVQRSTAITSTDLPWSKRIDRRKCAMRVDPMTRNALTGSPDHPLAERVVVGVAAGVATTADGGVNKEQLKSVRSE